MNCSGCIFKENPSKKGYKKLTKEVSKTVLFC